MVYFIISLILVMVANFRLTEVENEMKALQEKHNKLVDYFNSKGKDI